MYQSFKFAKTAAASLSLHQVPGAMPRPSGQMCSSPRELPSQRWWGSCFHDSCLLLSLLFHSILCTSPADPFNSSSTIANSEAGVSSRGGLSVGRQCTRSCGPCPGLQGVWSTQDHLVAYGQSLLFLCPQTQPSPRSSAFERLMASKFHSSLSLSGIFWGFLIP